MTRKWDEHEAKARFDEFLEASLKQGPQVVMRRGVEAAVLVSIERWRRIEEPARPSLKDLLLAPEPRTERLTREQLGIRTKKST